MDFEKQYPHPKLSNEFFTIKWLRGYTVTEIWFHNRLIGRIESSKQLLSGVSIKDEQIGLIEVKLEKNPFLINLKVNGYHSRINSRHPKNEVKAVSNWLYPGILYFSIASLVQFSTYLDDGIYSFEDYFFFYFHIGGAILLLTTFVLTKFYAPIFFFAGILIYLIQLVLLTYLMIILGVTHIVPVLLYLSYLGFVGMMFFPSKRVIESLKHKIDERNSSVIDN